MEMTDEHLKLRQEHDESHKETLDLLTETKQSLEDVQQVVSQSIVRLEIVRKKYEERLHGPRNP